MSEQAGAEPYPTQNDEETGVDIPVHQSPSEAGKEGEPSSYRKTEEDSTMLTQEERTGEGTSTEAGESNYSRVTSDE
jgi:hypothetical protein